LHGCQQLPSEKMVCLFYRVFEDECVLPLYFTVLGTKPRFINK